MPRLTTAIGVLAICVAVAVGRGDAQQRTEPVAIRLTQSQAPAALDRFVARNAQPLTLEANESLGRLTPRHLIVRHCGSVRSAYIEEYQALNGEVGAKLDAPVGDVDRLVLPACVYVQNPTKGLELSAAGLSSPQWAFEAFTGGVGSESEVAAYFRTSVELLRAWRPPSRLRGAYVTAPVSFTPNAGMSRSEFVAGFGVAAGDNNAYEELGEWPTAHIIIGATAADDSQQCAPSTDPPFEVAAVEAAYADASRGVNRARVEVAVVDNGFFGADARNRGQEFSGSPFPHNFFATANRGFLARTMDLNQTSHAINFLNGLSPDPVSGHGTHVTGIILGGPNFESARAVFAGEQAAWISIRHLNVGRGTRYMIPGAQSQLQNVLGLTEMRPIVNMSIAYDGVQSPDLYADFDRLFRSGPDSLFVVAAGNGGIDVSNNVVLPASFGGPAAQNVITVAALEGAGQLARLSNYGATTVDIAAPGCAIESWTANTTARSRQNGTSSAAPFVTFAAALLQSTDTRFVGRALKNRLILSGDLLDRPQDRARTAFGVRLNIAKALYWRHDIVRLTTDRSVLLLGEVEAISDVRCFGDQEMLRLANFRALKRAGASTRIFRGHGSSLVSPSCAAGLTGTAQIQFRPRFRVTGAVVSEVENGRSEPISMSSVEEIVMRAAF